MSEVTEEQIWQALKGVADDGQDVVSEGLVSGLIVKNGNVGFAIEVDPSEGAAKEPLRQACEKAVEALPGVLSVTVVLTAHRDAAQRAPDPSRGPAAAEDTRTAIPGIASIVAVASGKGGVGKSTMAVNLALALAVGGRRVGILDADIYGPSMPRMLGIQGRPKAIDGKRLEPMRNHGLACMSMGFLVDEDTPMIWRGPMVMQALEQMLREVEWGNLDLLVVDMPPGTGDAQLTMAQRVPLTGAIIVSTPQDIALIDARKGLAMFQRVNVPVFGIVENMSYYQCPQCGHRAEIFGHGGARKTADDLGMDFLGEVALDIRIRETSDSGQPVVATDPESAHAAAFRKIADKVADKIDAATGAEAPKAPKIVIQ